MRQALVLITLLWLVPGCVQSQENCGGAACAQKRGLDARTCYFEVRKPEVCTEGYAAPSARYLAALAYDADAHNFVLFGGETASGTSDETWAFSPPSAWRLATPVHKPPPRRGAAMAWDPGSHVILMYGGVVPDRSEGSVSDETWAYEGGDWKRLPTASGSPGAREGATMVTTGQRVLLFGGHVANTTYYGDAWTWDGSRWTRVDRDPTPEGRGNAGVMWDAGSSSLLVFGGNGLRAGAGPGNLGRPLADAWSLRDGLWSAISGPPDSLVMPSAYMDPSTKRVVVTGIICPASLGSTWELNTGRWVQLGGAGFGRWGVAVASGPADGAVLMFGGSTEIAC